MTHELDGMAKYRRAASRAADIRAERDAADQLRANAAAASVRPAPVAAITRAEANGAFKREPVAAAPVAKPVPAAVPQATTMEGRVRQALATVPQWTAADPTAKRLRVGTDGRRDGERGRWVVLSRNATGDVSDYTFVTNI